MLGEDEEADERAFEINRSGPELPLWPEALAFNFSILAFFGNDLVRRSSGYTVPEVLGVEEGFPAKEAGLLPGDVITHVNGRSIHS